MNRTAKTIVIRDRKGRSNYAIMSTQAEDYSKVKIAKLVFNRYGMQHFLAVISTPTFIAKLSKSKAQEKLLARNQKVQQEIIALTKKN